MTHSNKSKTDFCLRAGVARRLLFLGMVLLAGCAWSTFAGGDSEISGGLLIIERDIVYYDGPEFNPQRHILDLYLPGDRSNFPVLIFIHGGGWTSGNKSLYGYLGRTFAGQGLGVVIANYRLTDGTPQQVVHPGHIQDVARAFAWVYANIADYGGNPDKIFISGHSAGGHLVSLLAVDAGYLAAHDLSPDAIAGVMSLSGVYDVRAASLAGIFGNDPAQRAQASPITHVGEIQPPPFQVLYGENNLPGLGPQAVTFHAALLDVPAEAELMVFPGRNHITMITGILNPNDAVAQTMLRFINEH